MSADHEIWEFYDFRRTVRLNWRYYSLKLREKNRLNDFIEFFLAITASGSALAGFSFWKSDSGQIVWLVFSVMAALLSTARPILKLGKQVTRLVEVSAQYAALDGECESLTNQVRRRKVYTEEHFLKFQELLGRRNKMKVAMADEVADGKRISALQADVDREFPVDSFYVPKEVKGDRQEG